MSVVLVTGASRGIGAQIALHLAEVGHTVFAGLRDPSVHALDGAVGDVRPLVLDVTDPVHAQVAVEVIMSQEGRIDALVNNAGVAWFAPGEEMSEHVLRTTFETNFFGAVRLTQQALPQFRAQGHGRIAMVSTLAAVTGLPLESAYCASKSALEAFSESLRHEVGRFGVDLAVIEPSVTKGGLATSVEDPAGRPDSVYRPLLEHTMAVYASMEQDGPELVAEAVRRFIEGDDLRFRIPLGSMAPVLDAHRAAAPDRADEILRSALGIEWWPAGKAAPSDAPGPTPAESATS